MEPAGSPTIHLFFDLIAALVHRLEDASLEVPMIGFQSVFEIRAELGSLQNCEAARLLIKVPLEELA